MFHVKRGCSRSLGVVRSAPSAPGARVLPAQRRPTPPASSPRRAPAPGPHPHSRASLIRGLATGCRLPTTDRHPCITRTWDACARRDRCLFRTSRLCSFTPDTHPREYPAVDHSRTRPLVLWPLWRGCTRSVLVTRRMSLTKRSQLRWSCLARLASRRSEQLATPPQGSREGPAGDECDVSRETGAFGGLSRGLARTSLPRLTPADSAIAPAQCAVSAIPRAESRDHRRIHSPGHNPRPLIPVLLRATNECGSAMTHNSPSRRGSTHPVSRSCVSGLSSSADVSRETSGYASVPSPAFAEFPGGVRENHIDAWGRRRRIGTNHSPSHRGSSTRQA